LPSVLGKHTFFTEQMQILDSGCCAFHMCCRQVQWIFTVG